MKQFFKMRFSPLERYFLMQNRKLLLEPGGQSDCEAFGSDCAEWQIN